MEKRERHKTYRKQGEPSIEECQDLAAISIQQMRNKNREPTIESLVKRYLISDKMASALLSQEPPQTHPDHDAYPHAKID
ncbi:MAG: hypothetical protein ACHQ0Y_12285 [Thermodesulfovibrionales bacterium]